MSQQKNKKHYGHHRRRSPWPLLLLVGGGLLLVFVGIIALNRPSKPQVAIEVNGSPALKVDKQKVDLGNIKLGNTVDVSFELMNVGDQPLRFSKTPYIEVAQGC